MSCSENFECHRNSITWFFSGPLIFFFVFWYVLLLHFNVWVTEVLLTEVRTSLLYIHTMPLI